MARRRLTPAQPGYLAPHRSGTGTGLPVAPIAPIAQVSGQSAEAAALREITEGIQTARNEGRMVVDVPLADIAQGHLVRDRIALDAAEIAALKASIAAHGQRVPAEITPLPDTSGGDEGGSDEEGGRPPYAWGLISGWRRLRALSELYDETGEARFSTLRALVRPAEAAAQSYVAMVEENEIRVGLSYYERARVVAEAAARGVFADQSAALRTLFATASRAKRSKIASFIDIHEGLGDLLNFPAEIPERLGLALVSRLRLGDRSRIRTALRDARPGTAAAELALLERLARPPKADVSRAKRGAATGPGTQTEQLSGDLALRLDRKPGEITLTLRGTGADAALAEKLRAMLRDAMSV